MTNRIHSLGSDEAQQTKQPIEGMVCVPSGTFQMGSNDNQPESPIHFVNLPEFYIDETPVTNASFARFVEESGYEVLGRGSDGGTWRMFADLPRLDHPVVLVNWHDALAYATWYGKRLPTEAEWEKTARGGLIQNLFPWGNESPDDHSLTWKKARSNESFPPTAPVKDCPSHGFGTYAMVGNVWEWCSDWYQENYYQTSPLVKPTGPSDGQFRVRRGASWNVRQSFRLRCSTRGNMRPDEAHPNLGFRCAVDSSMVKANVR